jgi:hypothetical protein
MKNNFLGDALIAVAIGAVVMGLLGKDGTLAMCGVTVILGIVFAVSHAAPNDATRNIMVDALYSASAAIHAFEDQEGKMPEETGEFEALQRAGAEVDRALDLAMEVV